MLNLIIPIIAAVSGSLEMFLNKFILSKEKVGYKLFTSASFVLISVLMFIVSPFLFEYNKDFFLPVNLLFFWMIVGIGVVANIMLFHGMKSEKLTESDSMLVFGSMFTILLSAIIYSDERNLSVLIPALVASFALIWSHIKKHHLVFHKAALLVLGATFLFGVENVIVKYLLYTYNAFTLYFVRCIFVAVILVICFRPNLLSLGEKKLFHLTITQVLIIIQVVLSFYSFGRYGVVYTSLILTLLPVLLYVYALVWLKEKLEIKKAIAGVVILMCVVVAQII